MGIQSDKMQNKKHVNDTAANNCLLFFMGQEKGIINFLIIEIRKKIEQ